MSQLEVDKIKNTTSATSVKVDRTTSDGDIIELQKDGTTIGNIGVASSDLNIYGDVGIKFSGDDVRPTDSSGNNSDNAVDLGHFDVRWQDLYLGGNIYLGGTTSANALDDYEEGTWTPNLDFATSSTGSLSYTQNTGFYVKVGRSVFITAFINWNANNFTASSGSLRVSGLPFAASSTQDYRGGVAITYSSNPWTGVTIYQQAFRSEANQTVMTFDYSDGTDGSMNTDITSHTNISSNGEFMISGTYVV